MFVRFCLLGCCKKFQKEHLQEHILGLGIRLDNSEGKGFCPSLSLSNANHCKKTQKPLYTFTLLAKE